MGLVWHNCKTYPPSEDFNSLLYITNGNVVYPVVYKSGEYFYNGHLFDINNVDYGEEYWWADLNQTTQGFFPARSGTKSALLKYFDNPTTISGRNSMGCSENWYEPFFAVKEAFSKEEIESMSEKTICDLLKLARTIGEGLY